VASNLFDLLAYMHRKVRVASFLTMCPRVDGLFPVIISCLKKAEMIINAISMFCMGILYAFGIVSQSANSSPNLVAEYLPVLDDLIEMFFCQSGIRMIDFG
jgi:hypothetical protein